MAGSFVGRRLRRLATVVLLSVVTIGAGLGPAGVASADVGELEHLYAESDAYLAGRVQEISDANDVLLAVEWYPTVDGSVMGTRICMDPGTQERIPQEAFLWTADGELLARSFATEGISFRPPCFFDVRWWPSVPVSANTRYVSGFWVDGGQYSYVPHGLDHAVSNAGTGHLVAVSSADSTVGAGNGLYAYTSLAGPDAPFPTNSWENSDYLVSPEFTPVGH